MERPKEDKNKIVVTWKKKLNSVAWFAKKNKPRGCYVCGHDKPMG
jgi:hypothetical protein